MQWRWHISHSRLSAWRWSLGSSPYLAELTRLISPAAPAALVNAQDILAAEVPRQVANGHTLFNVGLAIFFLPLVSVFRRLIDWMVPEREETAAEIAVARFQPKYLDETLLLSPRWRSAWCGVRSRESVKHWRKC